MPPAPRMVRMSCRKPHDQATRPRPATIDTVKVRTPRGRTAHSRNRYDVPAIPCGQTSAASGQATHNCCRRDPGRSTGAAIRHHPAGWLRPSRTIQHCPTRIQHAAREKHQRRPGIRGRRAELPPRHGKKVGGDCSKGRGNCRRFWPHASKRTREHGASSVPIPQAAKTPLDYRE